MRSGTFVVALVGVLALSAPAVAQIYKWTDERGVTHFGNVAPPGVDAETVQPAPSQAEDGAEPAPAAQEESDDTAAPERPAREGPYASLSDDAFSSVVTRERGSMRRELAAAKRELTEATAELERERGRKAAPTPSAEFDRIIQGVTGIGEGPPPDRENELAARKDAALKKVEAIEQRFGELEQEAIARYGSLPGWWMPLER
jgi:hypothetical protein